MVDRARSTSGFFVLLLAMALASPGVRVTQAEGDFSYDPALEPSPPAVHAAAQPPTRAQGPARVRQDQAPGTCAAREAAPILPLHGMPLLIAEGGEGEGLNSLNSRGYNIGKLEPAGELRHLEIEVLRRSQGR